MRTYVNDQLVTFNGPAVKVEPRSADPQTLATIRIKSASDSATYPGVTSHQYGKGRVAYFSAGLVAGYYLYAYPYQRLALKHAVTWAGNEKPPVQVMQNPEFHSSLLTHDIYIVR